ncbi:uncharacterized protein LOC143230545 [Tachypleus tridentatus]|uniref:uncharacterized protein LOC143230545 n=1 Tax=Tachypleus tridentatus TaxID=6853 RepID=UPI003FD39AB9
MRNLKLTAHIDKRYYVITFKSNISKLNKQDLKILGAQFCTHLLAAGVLCQIEDENVPLEVLFRPDLMYYWTHLEAQTANSPSPGWLSTNLWPPLPAETTEQRPKISSIDFQHISMGLKSGNKDELPKLQKEENCGLQENIVIDYEFKMAKLQQEVEKYQTLVGIQELTCQARDLNGEGLTFTSSLVQTDMPSLNTFSTRTERQTRILESVSIQTNDEKSELVTTETQTERFMEDISVEVQTDFELITVGISLPTIVATTHLPVKSLVLHLKFLHHHQSLESLLLHHHQFLESLLLLHHQFLESLLLLHHQSLESLLLLHHHNPLESLLFLHHHHHYALEFNQDFQEWVLVHPHLFSSPAPPTGGWYGAYCVGRKPPVTPAAPIKPLYWTRIQVSIQDPERAAVYNFDTSVVDVDTLQAVYEVRPSAEEIELIKNHVTTKPDIPLDKPEQFLYELAQIPVYADRVACIMFQATFAESIGSIENKLNNLKMTCTETEQVAKQMDLDWKYFQN